MYKLRYVILGILLMCVYTSIYLQHSTAPTDEDCRYLGLFVIIQFAYSLYSWWKVEGYMFSAYIVFLIAFYAFNTGQVILEYLGLSQDAHLLLNGYLDSKGFYDGAFFSMSSLLFFHFGALMVTNKRSKEKTSLRQEELHASYHAIRKIAISIAFMSAPFYIYNLIINLATVAVYGYSGLYDNNASSRFVAIIGDFYVPALIALYFASEYSGKGKKLCLLILLFTVFLPPFILGGRSSIAIISAVLLIVYTLFYEIKKRHIIVMSIGVIALLFSFFVISLIRHSATKDINLIRMVLQDNDENPIAGILQEMGFSMFPVSWTIENVPRFKDYEYGTTYLWELFSIVPNIGFGEIHPAKVHESSQWMQKQSGYSFGLGYSLIAEAYNNFGWYGILFMFFNGYVYCRMFKSVNRRNMKVNPILVLAAVIFLWFSIKGVRNSFLGTVRGVFYYTLPLYWLMTYFKNKYVNNKISKHLN